MSGRATDAVLRALLLGVSFALAACNPIPEPFAEEVDAPEEAEEAIALAAAEWFDRLGMRPHCPPPVRWFEGRCLLYEQNSTCRDGVYWSWAAEEIHLLQHPRASEGSLAHELLHWALESSTGSMDQVHSDPTWGEVEDVRVVLAEAGL